MQKKLKATDILVIILDILAAIAAFFAAYFIRSGMDSIGKPFFAITEYTWILWIFIPTQYLAFAYFGLYGSKKTNAPLTIAATLAKSYGITALIAATAVFVVKSDTFSRLMFIIFIVLSFCLVLAERLSVRAALKRTIDKNSARKRIVIALDGSEDKILKKLRAGDDFLVTVVGFAGINSEKSLGNISDIYKIAVENTVDEVYFVIDGQTPPANLYGAMEICENLGITVKVMLDMFKFKLSKTSLSYEGSMPVLTFHTVTLNEGQLVLKRLTDILGAVAGLAVTAVLTLFIAPAIKLDSKGPVFFSQMRVGQNGRKFRLYKFRTMEKDAESHLSKLLSENEMSGAVFKMENDPRVTRVGKFLRKTSLDELPQFWNILKGEMSLVGTRPPTVGEVEQYEISHRRRLSIKPGLTGLWQVSGRNEITDFEDICALDTSYIDNWSLMLDIKILFKTVSAVLLRRGAK